jgi:hypothetical protein
MQIKDCELQIETDILDPPFAIFNFQFSICNSPFSILHSPLKAFAHSDLLLATARSPLLN